MQNPVLALVALAAILGVFNKRRGRSAFALEHQSARISVMRSLAVRRAQKTPASVVAYQQIQDRYPNECECRTEPGDACVVADGLRAAG